MTRYLERLLAGETPSVGEWNEHLVEFHRAYDDADFATATLLRTQQLETSYEFFARRLHELAPGAGAILDVGCGAGNLLLHLKQRFGNRTHLAGIDLSPKEIARARSLVPSADVRVGDAGELHFGDAQFDAIVAHLSFRFLANLRSALPRLRGAMRSSGALVFLIEEPWHSSLLSRITSAGIQTIRKRAPAFVPFAPATEPLVNDDELRILVEQSGFTGQLSSENVLVSAAIDREQLAAFIDRTYLFGLFDKALLHAIKAAIMDEVESHSPNGPLRLEMPLKLVTVGAS